MATVSANKRIAIVAASAPPYGAGGVASAHYNLYKALRNAGYQARLFTFFDNGKIEDNSGEIKRFGAPIALVNFLFWAVRSFFQIFDSGKSTYEVATIVRSFLGAYRMTKAIDQFDPDVIVLSDHGAPGLPMSTKSGRLVLLVSHHNPMRFTTDLLEPPGSRLDASCAVALENRVLRKVDKVLCPSNYMKKWFESTYRFNGPVEVVPNIIDIKTADQVESQPINEALGVSVDVPLIYMPSAGTRIKGGNFFEEIVGKLAKQHAFGVYLPGYVDQELKPEVDALRRQVPIYTPGHVEYEQHVAIVKTCAFGISPALMENFSMAIFEAIYLGVPMIVFNAGGNEDLIEEGKNGFLIEAYDQQMMINVAAELLSSDTLPQFRKGVKEFTREKFDSSQILDVYLEAMGLAK